MKEKNTTDEKIIKAAKELFLENGYHETSMSAIAQTADLGKGTLYWHFDSKDELFQSIVTKEAKKVLKKFEKLTEKDLAADEILKRFIKIRLENIDENKKTTQMFMDGENFINEELKNTMIEIFRSFINIVENIIKQGVNEGIFYTSDPEKSASAFIGMINGICSTIIFTNKRDIDIEENTEFLYQLFLKGLQSQEEVEENDEINKK